MKKASDANRSSKSKSGAAKQKGAPAARAPRANEVVKHLLGEKKVGGGPVSGKHDSPLHGDTHVDTNSPDVHNNYSDSGKHTDNHLNTHTNTHGDQQRS